MSPYEIFAELVRNEPGTTFRDQWQEFANWESLRFFHEDPSRSSKDAIQWVVQMNELAAQIENDYSGLGKARCLEAIEDAFVAFSRLDLPDELCQAVRTWRAERLREELTQDETTTIGEDLLK